MDQQQPSRWRPTRKQLLWVVSIATLVLGIMVVICAYLFGWKWTGIPERTLWDWLELLLAVLTTAVIGYLGYAISTAQYRAQEQHAQDEALQTYLDQMGQLLLDRDHPFRQSPEDSEERTLVRARTLTVLRRLDGERKGRVLQFLYDSELINKDARIIELRQGDLREAHVGWATLSEADLRWTDLSEAHLTGANLSGADLSGAWLYGADLDGANLSGADLSDAEGFTNEELDDMAKSLEGATMPDGQKYEDWLKSKGSGEDGEKE